MINKYILYPILFCFIFLGQNIVAQNSSSFQVFISGNDGLL